MSTGSKAALLFNLNRHKFKFHKWRDTFDLNGYLRRAAATHLGLANESMLPADMDLAIGDRNPYANDVVFVDADFCYLMFEVSENERWCRVGCYDEIEEEIIVRVVSKIGELGEWRAHAEDRMELGLSELAGREWELFYEEPNAFDLGGIAFTIQDAGMARAWLIRALESGALEKTCVEALAPIAEGMALESKGLAIVPPDGYFFEEAAGTFALKEFSSLRRKLFEARALAGKNG